jgi:hypothetical protein
LLNGRPGDLSCHVRALDDEHSRSPSRGEWSRET